VEVEDPAVGGSAEPGFAHYDALSSPASSAKPQGLGHGVDGLGDDELICQLGDLSCNRLGPRWVIRLPTGLEAPARSTLEIRRACLRHMMASVAASAPTWPPETGRIDPRHAYGRTSWSRERPWCRSG